MTFSICSSTSFHLNILYFQGQPQGYNQQGFNQAPSSQSQYNNQGSIHQQPQPPGQPPGSSPQQQRPTPQPSPHQQVSPVPSPSPAHRLTPNPSPGPTRPQPQPSPGKQRTSQPSPSPSQRSSSSQQQSPPGSSPGQQHASQHNHLSSPKVRVFFCNNGYLERDGVLTSQLKKGGGVSTEMSIIFLILCNPWRVKTIYVNYQWCLDVYCVLERFTVCLIECLRIEHKSKTTQWWRDLLFVWLNV